MLAEYQANPVHLSESVRRLRGSRLTWARRLPGHFLSLGTPEGGALDGMGPLVPFLFSASHSFPKLPCKEYPFVLVNCGGHFFSLKRSSLIHFQSIQIRLKAFFLKHERTFVVGSISCHFSRGFPHRSLFFSSKSQISVTLNLHFNFYYLLQVFPFFFK